MNTTTAATSPSSAILRQGVAAVQAKEFDRARELLQRVTHDTPDNPLAWYWLAVASPSADAAIPCLRRVLGLDAQHAPAREALARLLVTEARAAAAAGRRDDARTLTIEATTLAPESTVPWQALADLSTSQDERIDALRKLVPLAPDDSGLRTQYRQALLARAVIIASSDRAEARILFREVAELNPGDVRVWQALCNLADSREEHVQALRDLLRAAPDHQQARGVLRNALVDDARTLAAAGRADQAHARWRDVLELGGDIDAWLGLADTTSDADEAARARQAAFELDPADPRVVAAFASVAEPDADPGALPSADDAFGRFEHESASPGTAIEIDDSALQALTELPTPTPTPTPMPAPAPAVAPAVAPMPAADQPTVMVVDDSPTIRKILGLTLERAGYRVVAEVNGNAALERLKDLVPGVILLDISMPDLDGYEVCKRIKGDPRTTGVPVIMLSGKGAFFDKVKGHMAGATEYLTKPFETPAVLAVVTSHCPVAVEAQHG